MGSMMSCFGKQTFKHSTTQATVVGWDLTNASVDNPIDYRDTIFLQKIVAPTRTHAEDAGHTKHNGQWYFYHYDQPSHEILVQLTVKKRVSGVETAHSCLLFLLTNSGAPLAINISTVPDVKSCHTEICLLYAKGYVVRPGQCKGLWGLDMPRSILSHRFDQEEVEDDYEITSIHDKSPYLPTTKNVIDGGLQKNIAVIARPRRKLIV